MGNSSSSCNSNSPKNSEETKNNDINNKIDDLIDYDDIEKKSEYIKNYRAFLAELNHKINNLNDHLNIALYSKQKYDDLFSKEESIELLNDIENNLNKINEMESLLEKQKTELKNLESNFKIIQEKFNEVNISYAQNFTLSKDNKLIQAQIAQSTNIIKKLKENKFLCDQKKNEMDNEIKNILNKTEKKVNFIKKRQLNDSKYLHLIEDFNDIFKEMNDSLFSKGSMLLAIKSFTKVEKMLQ